MIERNIEQNDLEVIKKWSEEREKWQGLRDYKPIRREVAKLIKKTFLNKGFELDKYVSTSTKMMFYKKKDGYYLYFNVFVDNDNLLRADLACSKVIYSYLYPYGDSNLVDTVNLYYLIREKFDEYEGYWLNMAREEFDSAEPVVEKLVYDYGRVADTFFNEMLEKIKNNKKAEKQFTYLQSFSHKFLNNWGEFELMEEQEYVKVLKLEFKEGLKKDFWLKEEITSEKPYDFCTAHEMYNKGFEKKLTNNDMKNKFNIYCIFAFDSDYKDKEVNSFTDGMMQRGAYMYSAFMTFIEKAY